MTTDKDIHATALERYEDMSGAWSSVYNQMEEDIDFLLGDTQWNDGRTYESDKVKLTVNKCPAFVNNVINEMRASRPAIKASPVDDKADPRTAEVLKGLIRNIETVSDASTAYDIAAFFQVTAGLGFIRVGLDWIPGTFDQEPKIESVDDFTSVLIDEMSVKIDGSDMRDAFVVRNDMAEDEFKRLYPDASPIDFEGNKSGWFSDQKTVRIAEYFYKELTEEEIHLLEDGTVIRDKQLKEYQETLEAELGPLNITQSRMEEVELVKWCKLNGQEILEKTDWVGKYIPIVPVYGNYIRNNGERHIFGMIKNLKDVQRMYNYWKSAHAEIIALQPKTPYILAEGQDEGYEKDWKDANRKNRPYLLYNHVVKNGVPAAPPMRQPPPQPSQAMFQEALAASDDMKTITGQMYDEGSQTLGAESGRAILAKQRQADASSYHYIDNQSKAIRQVGKILIDIIPKVYNGPRIVRILGEDGEEENIRVNQLTEIKEKGKTFQGIYDLNVGKYDVSVSVGPSFASKRQEAVESMMEAARINPAIMQIAGDLLLKNMDFPGAEEIAERIKKTMPPEIANDEQTPEQIALQQAGQAMEILKAKLAEQEQALDDKSRSENMKHQIDLMKVENDKRKTEIDAFEAQIKLMEAQAKVNEAIPPEAFGRVVETIMRLSEQLDDASGALEILLNDPPDEQNSPQEPPPEGGFFMGE